MEKRHTLTDNTALRRYEFDLGGDKAVIEYILGPGYRILTHTEVPPKFEGQGIGRELVAAALEDLRDKKLQVIPQCSFVAQYIDKIMVTITDDDTANLKIRIFTGKSTERWLSNLAERSQSRAGHTFKKMIEKYENDIKASK